MIHFWIQFLIFKSNIFAPIPIASEFSENATKIWRNCLQRSVFEKKPAKAHSLLISQKLNSEFDLNYRESVFSAIYSSSALREE